MVDKFNIRVYGILLKEDKILLSHENIDGYIMTKLPGGGLELGEGLVEGVRREFKEELNIAVEVDSLVHVTQDYIQSAFRKNEQIIAVHYLVKSGDEILAYSSTQETSVGRKNNLNFEWVKCSYEMIERLTFEMDKQALRVFLSRSGG